MSTETQYCTFYLGEDFFGIEVSRVQEILRYQDMTEVPLSAPVIRGLINLRGQIMTAVDLRERVGLPPREDGKRPINVVIRRKDGGVSLLVDSIGDVMSPSEELAEAPPENVNPRIRALLQGVYKLEGRLLQILDPDKLMEFEGAAA